MVSKNFGAGWSSWNIPELAYDKRVVEFWLAHKDDRKWMNTVEQWAEYHHGQSDANKEAVAFFNSLDYDFSHRFDNCPYMGGFADIELEWVPRGVSWRIKEYDGAETIEFRDDCDWIY